MIHNLLFSSNLYLVASFLKICLFLSQFEFFPDMRLGYLILNNDKRWSQKKLIQALNAKLNGWASYHRITEAGDAFNHIDVVVSVLLLNLTKQMYPKKPLKTIIKKFDM